MIEIPKTDAPHFEEPPLSWKPIWVKRDGEMLRSALFTCPGKSTGSIADWTIADDGTVSPSIDCRCGCGFHDFVRLVVWEPRR